MIHYRYVLLASAETCSNDPKEGIVFGTFPAHVRNPSYEIISAFLKH